MNQLKIGVIGTGHMGGNHVRNISEERRFEFVGIYDKDGEQAEKIANRYSVKKFDDMDMLLDSVDAVVVSVPSFLHKEVALKAAAHKVHALIEKPLALNCEDAELITDTFAKENLKLAVGHVERFNPVFMELCKLVQSDQIFFVEAHRYSPFSGSGRITDTSVIEDLMIHDIDLVCELMNPFTAISVEGTGEQVKSNKIDFATGILKFEGNAHAIINASRVAQNKERMLTIHTVDSCISADLLSHTLSISKNSDLVVDGANSNSYKQDGLVQRIFVPMQEPLRAELIAFYNSVVNDAPVAVDGKAGTRAIRICGQVAKATANR
jgi:predicted dehydrogenase